MSQFQLKYRFSSKPWKYTGPSAWWFVTIPQELSQEIRANFKDMEEGWGRLSATACIQQYEWKTAIWFDTKQGAYLLPLKADIRKKLDNKLNDELEIEVRL